MLIYHSITVRKSDGQLQPPLLRLCQGSSCVFCVSERPDEAMEGNVGERPWDEAGEAWAQEAMKGSDASLDLFNEFLGPEGVLLSRKTNEDRPWRTGLEVHTRWPPAVLRERLPWLAVAACRVTWVSGMLGGTVVVKDRGKSAGPYAL